MAFLLTNNPARWAIDAEYMTGWVEATAAGHSVEGRWSTGLRTKKIQVGDRAFLLRQGTSGRGIFASGRFVSDAFQTGHWDGGGGTANYADVMWDTALKPDDALPIEMLFVELPDGQWEPQASGSQVSSRDRSAARSLATFWLQLLRVSRNLAHRPSIWIGQYGRVLGYDEHPNVQTVVTGSEANEPQCEVRCRIFGDDGASDALEVDAFGDRIAPQLPSLAYPVVRDPTILTVAAGEEG